MLEEGALFSFVLLLNSESVGYLEILFTEKPYLFSPVIRSSACSFPLSIVISSSFRIISRPRWSKVSLFQETLRYCSSLREQTGVRQAGQEPWRLSLEVEVSSLFYAYSFYTSDNSFKLRKMFQAGFYMLEINGTILNTRGSKRNMHKIVPFVMESYIRTLFLNKNWVSFAIVQLLVCLCVCVLVLFLFILWKLTNSTYKAHFELNGSSEAA